MEEQIPFDAKEARVRLTGEDDGEVFVLKIGYLEPARTIGGAQARLHNLGYNPGPIDSLMGPRTERALKMFQHDQELEVTGELDEKTVHALIDMHAC